MGKGDGGGREGADLHFGVGGGVCVMGWSVAWCVCVGWVSTDIGRSDLLLAFKLMALLLSLARFSTCVFSYFIGFCLHVLRCND